jgi:hypothetical protein
MARCYLCEEKLPAGQSVYEDHGVQVCLRCFTSAPRCQQCRFPSHQLTAHPTKGQLCEFCAEHETPEDVVHCYLCQKPMAEYDPYFEDYGVRVCKPCFKKAPRCFLCRFPNRKERVMGLGNVCEFCAEHALTPKSDLVSLAQPLQQFVAGFGHNVPELPPLRWVDWRVLLGMQMDGSRPQFRITFLDEYLHYAYPAFYLKGAIYLLPRMSPSLLMPHLAGQLVAYDICQRYQLPHLLGHKAFQRIARGWSHWVAWRTAKQLKCGEQAKQLSRWPENHLTGEYSKFRTTGDLKGDAELRQFAELGLKKYAQRDLTDEMRWTPED